MTDPKKDATLNPGDEPNKVVPNTQSTKPVAPGAVSKADPDHIKVDPDKKEAIEAKKTDLPQDSVRASDNVLNTKPEEQPGPDTSNAAFERALLEKDGQIDPQMQKNIDTVLGDHSEDPEIRHDDKSYLRANPHDPGDSLRKDLNYIRERDEGIQGRLKAFAENYESPVALITRLVRDVPADTPDEFTVWGASGHVLRMGHLRMLVMGMQ